MDKQHQLMKISTWLLIVNGIVFALAGTAVVVFVNYNMRQRAITNATAKVQVMGDQYLAIHTYFTKKLKPPLLELTDPIRSKDYFEPTWMSSTYAVREINKYIRSQGGGEYYLKDAAADARSPENEANEYEKAFLSELNENQELKHRYKVEDVDGRPYLVFLRRGELMEKSCLYCHGSPDQAPGGMIRHYGSERSFNRKEGDWPHAVSIRVPLSSAYAEANLFSFKLSGMFLAFLFSLFGLQVWLNKRVLFKPLGIIHEKALLISTDSRYLGDEIPPFSGRELNRLSQSFNKMSASLRSSREDLEQRVLKRTEELSKSNKQLQQEIMERKEAEEEIKSLARFPSENPYPVLRIARDGTILYGNEASIVVLNTWGCQIGQRLPDHWRELISDVFGSGSSQHTEIKCGDRLFSLTFEPVVDADYVNVYGLDITERKRAEGALRESEERYRALYEFAAEGIIAADIETKKLSHVNPAICRMLGYTEEELNRMSVLDIHPKESLDYVISEFEAQARGEKVLASNIPCLRKDGTVIHADISTTNIVLDGRACNVGFFTDITEKRDIEARLRNAEKMEAIGTLAGGIAHDFNNLLMGIQGNVSLMSFETDPTHPHYDMLKTIEKQVRSGSSLTRQLLGYARKGQYDVKSVNLNKLVQETSETLGRTRRQITIHRELAGNLFAIEADQGQIEQIILNLYVNASDAMPGGGDLTLKTTNVTDQDMKDKSYDAKPGNYVLLTVTDTGSGMDKETQSRIFDPFFTTKSMASGRGTGLGLASAYGIVKAHAGYIDVESEKGKGTTFSIYLPATEKRVEKEKAVEVAEQAIKGTGTVLLVDDEEVVLEVGTKLLEKLGYAVLDAESGRKALELYKDNRDKIDIVVLDMVMPDVGGGEAYDKMKEINPDVKVLLSSGYSIEDVGAKEILNRGCDGFIQKPFTMEQLSQSIQQILRKE